MFLHYYDGILVPFFAKTKPYSVVRRIIKAVFMYIFPLTIMVYVYPPIIFSNITYLLTGLLLTYLFFDIGYPLLKYRREAISMDDKLKKSYEVEQQSFLGFHSNCLYSNQTIINLSHLAVLAIIMAATAWVSGIKLGQREAWFLTFMKDRSEYALIRNYRSEKIGAKIIKCGITNSYILLDSVTELKLTLKYIPTRTSSCKSLK